MPHACQRHRHWTGGQGNDLGNLLSSTNVATLFLNLALPTEPVRVEADAARITQVVDNLLDNAIKYTPEGGSIEVSVTAENSLAVCRVRDSGEGMDPAMLPLLFDLFAQADRTLDRAKGGLGIGLSLVKRLVELHGGQVEASSAGEHKGSEFVVRLPLLVADAVPSQAGESATTPSASASRRILVVDDNPDVAHSFAMLLEIIGHQVMIAPDGPTALGMVETFRPEIIFLDIGLPGMDGYEVARRLSRSCWPKSIRRPGNRKAKGGHGTTLWASACQ